MNAEWRIWPVAGHAEDGHTKIVSEQMKLTICEFCYGLQSMLQWTSLETSKTDVGFIFVIIVNSNQYLEIYIINVLLSILICFFYLRPTGWAPY